jgi:hypothetical protein
LEDLKEPKATMDIQMLIPESHQVIDQGSWSKINAAEISAGEPAGKPRIKEVSWTKLLSLGLN